MSICWPGWTPERRFEKERAAGQNLRGLRVAVHLAQEVGALLG
ncbi:hypothetical protein KPSA3_04902 [Pseudomonas syringae pv. actinidiae]|uniref:Uncharacterized protein n=1 Tax=Pseudomonas syringae pv. actinidiae TaxID=103796 RepID=A0AAN4Q9G5_PSESF|nr:hypothetical protein KPSA3_04902 [Pseudomonas syringae pv. actinidiae]